MSLYRCVNKFCEENLDYNPGVANEVILNDREKEIPFNARILLTCGHSICEKCIYGIAVKNQNFYKCDDCGKTTSFSQRTIDKVRNNKPKLNPIVRWNEDGADDLNYEAFSIGAAFNSGRISVSSTPVVDLDGKYSLVFHQFLFHLHDSNSFYLFPISMHNFKRIGTGGNTYHFSTFISR